MYRVRALPFLCGLVVMLGLSARTLVIAQDETTPAPMEPAAGATEATAVEPAGLDVPSAMQLAYSIDNLLLFLAAVLVIFMQAGFALVESGLNAAKNTVNILYKNLIDFCLGVLLYWVVGYGLMYPGADFEGKLFGFGGVGIAESATDAEIEAGFSAAPGTLRFLHPQVNFLFQVAFCATAATIVSGAVAGRIKFSSYLVYTAVLTAFVYPVSGMWKWGGGWLNSMGFWDFAGSLVVHACGGFAGLAGAIMLGPRKGRFTSDGKSVAMPGHNMTLATLGVFILLIGWYGFNPGSQLAFAGTGNVHAVMLIAVNTTLAACAGGVVAMFLTWAMWGKPELTMALNGVLGGLVGITANCDCVTNVEAMIIGAAAAPLVILAVKGLDLCKIDDPVGAFPVHGVCGIWGGIATGLFGTDKDLVTQLIGSAAIAGWAFGAMLIVFGALKAVGQLRVSEEEESVGLDISEHGMEAYAH